MRDNRGAGETVAGHAVISNMKDVDGYGVRDILVFAIGVNLDPTAP